MLCGKELILATRPFAKERRSESWFHTLTTFSLLVLALAGTVVMPFMILRILSSLLAGLLIIRMFIIYHDHQHHSILTKSTFANALMTLFGIYMLSPTSIWKRSHDHHHKHNSKLFGASIGSYPIATKKKVFGNVCKGKVCLPGHPSSHYHSIRIFVHVRVWHVHPVFCQQSQKTC